MSDQIKVTILEFLRLIKHGTGNNLYQIGALLEALSDGVSLKPLYKHFKVTNINELAEKIQEFEVDDSAAAS